MDTATPLDSPRPALPARGLIVRRDEAAPVLDGTAFLEAARRAAEGLERDVTAALDEARRRGYADGRREACSEAARLLADAQARADAFLAGLEADLARLALDAVRRILAGFDDATLAVEAARSALLQARTDRRLSLIVGPELAEPMQRMVASLAAPGGGDRRIAVEANPRLAGGRCVLATPDGYVELGAHEQLAAMARSLDAAVDTGAGT